MPMFAFQCHACGLRFEKMSGSDEVPCKKCKAPSIRVVAGGVGVSSGHVPSGPVPQNTGASLVDHDEDWVIARDASMKLREMQGRQDYKRRVMEQEGVGGHRLSRMDDGQYFVMTEEQQAAAKKARILHQEALGQKPKAPRHK